MRSEARAKKGQTPKCLPKPTKKSTSYRTIERERIKTPDAANLRVEWKQTALELKYKLKELQDLHDQSVQTHYYLSLVTSNGKFDMAYATVLADSQVVHAKIQYGKRATETVVCLSPQKGINGSNVIYGTFRSLFDSREDA